MPGTAAGCHQCPLSPQEVAEGYIPGAVPHSSQQLSQAAAVAPVGSKTQARAEASNTTPASRQLPVPTVQCSGKGGKTVLISQKFPGTTWGAVLKTAVVGKVKTLFPGS